MQRSLLQFLSLLAILSLATPAAAIDKQLVAGAGPSTKIVQLFFDYFSAKPAAVGYQFLVPERSAKHAGGLKSSDDFLFGRTGRPLTTPEKQLQKEEIFLAKVPIAFAVGGEVGLSQLSLQQLKDLYLGKINNWRELGGPDAKVVLVGREATEALFSTLKETYPFFQKVRFAKSFRKDHQVVNFLKSPQGGLAIGFGAKPNLSALNVLQVEGFTAGVNVGLVYDLKHQQHPLVAAVKDYAQSAAWRSKVTTAGLLPAD